MFAVDLWAFLTVVVAFAGLEQVVVVEAVGVRGPVVVALEAFSSVLEP